MSNRRRRRRKTYRRPQVDPDDRFEIAKRVENPTNDEISFVLGVLGLGALILAVLPPATRNHMIATGIRAYREGRENGLEASELRDKMLREAKRGLARDDDDEDDDPDWIDDDDEED